MKKIAEIVNEFVKKNKFEEEYICVKIRDIWEQKFPKTIIDNVKVINFKSGILEFFINSSAWKKEINLRKKEIIDKINEELGENLVIDIKT